MLLPSPRQGILKAFDPPARTSVAPPSFVGKQASLYGGTYFDLPVLWGEVKNIIKQFSPQMHQQIQNQINSPQLPVHLERDLINTFGSRWYLYLPSEVVSETSPRKIHGLMAGSLKDSKTLRDSIDTMLTMYGMGAQITKQEYKGTTINQLPRIPIGRKMSSGNLAPLKICYFFRNDYVFLSTTMDLAKDAIDDLSGGISPLV